MFDARPAVHIATALIHLATMWLLWFMTGEPALPLHLFFLGLLMVPVTGVAAFLQVCLAVSLWRQETRRW